MNSRYYNPEWGRFVNGDGLIGNIGKLLSHNMFAYCENNTINGYDPSGYQNIADCMGGGGGVADCLLALYVMVSYSPEVADVVQQATVIVTSSGNQITALADMMVNGERNNSSGNDAPEQSPQKPRKPDPKHHSYLKALGGAVAQKLIQIAPELHQKLHSALYKFEDGWLAPKRGYIGKMIQDLFGAKNIQDGLMRFYNSNEEFKIFIEPLKEAIKFTGI